MGGVVRRLLSMFSRPEFAFLAFLLGFIALNWPLLEAARIAGDYPLFLYFFGIWGAIIVLALLISQTVAEQDPEDNDDA